MRRARHFLPEQRVAAVAGAEAPDRVVEREVADVAALGIDVAEAVQAARELVVVAELLPGDVAHARHDAHADRDVERIGELHADLRQRRADRAHDERHDVHRPPAHAAVEQRRAAWRTPALGSIQLLVGPAMSSAGRADEGEVLAAGDVVGIGAVQVAAGQLLLVELDEDALARRPARAAPAARRRCRRTRRCGRAGTARRTRRPTADARRCVGGGWPASWSRRRSHGAWHGRHACHSYFGVEPDSVAALGAACLPRGLRCHACFACSDAARSASVVVCR